jgi:hypothetical protein
MKQFLPLVVIVAFIGILFACGCTGTAPQTPVTTQVSTIAPTAPPVLATTPAASGRVFINERINLQSGYQTTYQKYNFADYGYTYLYPKDTVSISINADKPVNVLVIDKADEIKFPTIEPEYNTILKKDQYDYSPVVPVLSQSNVLKKDMTLTIKDKSTYFLIIDPRFSSNQAGWHSSTHEEVHVDVKVTKS